MVRAPCCDKANMKRGPWSPEEDATLKNYLEKHGTGGNWITLPHKAGLKRCGKSCRLRWLNYLRPDIKHGGFTEEEDNIICTLYSSMGSRWSVIASQLQGRTDNDVKNYWNTKLKKKLLAGKIGLKSSTNNSNNITTKNTSHLNSAQLSASVPKVETYNYVNSSACFDTSSSTLLCPMDMSYLQNYDSQGQQLYPSDQLPLPGLMEMSDFATSVNNSSSISLSQEVLLSRSNSSVLALENSYALLSDNGSAEEEKALLEFGFQSQYDLLNGFSIQENTSEIVPYLGN